VANEYDPRPGDGNLPIPDPTRLTTQLVDRALAAFREVMETRLAGMDRATRLLAEALDKSMADKRDDHARIRGDSDRQAAAQREYILSRVERVADISLEKFASIETRFVERDTRTAQAANESRVSLDAALAAAKEAVSLQNEANSQAITKSEVATQKQIDALLTQVATTNKSLEDKITDLKGRLDRGEGKEKGVIDSGTVAGATRLQSNWHTGLLVTVGFASLSALISITILVITLTR
jgi:hypothetical protein